MKSNKKLFFDVLKQVTTCCNSEGFVEHPAYVTAWDSGNQAYQATLIRLVASTFMDQFNVSFYPSWRSFRFYINRSTNSFGIKTVEDVPNDAHEWTDCWHYQPFDEYLLVSRGLWNIFSTKNHFGVRKGNPIDVEAEAFRIGQAFALNSVFLFDALEGRYSGRRVDVSHYEIERPI